MENTLLTFQDQYYIYDGDQFLDEKGLAIGGFESAWLAEWPRTFLSKYLSVQIALELKYEAEKRSNPLSNDNVFL
jgi:hypothetical protein